jgi:hypothetical protein
MGRQHARGLGRGDGGVETGAQQRTRSGIALGEARGQGGIGHDEWQYDRFPVDA